MTGAKSAGTSLDRALVPATRWRLGHRVFFHLLQGIVVAYDELAAAEAQGHSPEAPLRTLTNLHQGAAAALRYAADFSDEAYDFVVLPSMSPPFVGTDFSGLLGMDHSAMRAASTRAKFALEKAKEAFPDAYREFTWSFTAAYEAHVHVCDKFGGGQRLSLRGHGDKPPATETLRRMQESRESSFRPPE